MESVKFLESIRKARMHAKELQLWTQEFIIIPYQTTGYIDITNQGFLNQQSNPENFNTFRRLYTGKESINLVWKNSVYAQQVNNEYLIKFQLGEVLMGLIETTDHLNEIKADSNFNDYVSQQVNKHYKFRVYPTFKLTDYYQYLLYKIPELAGSTVFRVVGIEEDFVGDEIVAYVFDLESINQAFAQTGSAVQQAINNSTPGSGYLEATVYAKADAERFKEVIQQQGLIKDKDYYELADKFVTGSFSKLRNNPIKKACLKVYAASAPMSLVFVGRRADINNNKIYPSGLIFGFNWKTKSPTFDLYKSGSILDNFYMGKFKTEVVFSRDILETLKTLFNYANKWDYQGFLTYDKNQINGSNNSGIFWQPIQALNDWEIGAGNNTFKPINFINVIATANNFFMFKGRQKFPVHDFFFINYFRNKEWRNLPYTVRQVATSKGFFGSIIQTIFGKTVELWQFIKNVFTGQLWQSGSMLSSRDNDFYAIIPADLIELNDKLFQGNKIPFNVFDTEKDGSNPSTILLNAASQQITLYGDLTNSFYSRKYGKVFRTYELDQTHYENGQPIIDGTERLLIHGDEELVYDREGYIIEGFQFEALANCDFSIELFNANEDMVYQGFFQTETKWTGNYRNFRTERNLNAFGNIEKYFNNPPAWPEPSDINRPRNDIFSKNLAKEIAIEPYGTIKYGGTITQNGWANFNWSGFLIKYNIPPDRRWKDGTWFTNPINQAMNPKVFSVIFNGFDGLQVIDELNFYEKLYIPPIYITRYTARSSYPVTLLQISKGFEIEVSTFINQLINNRPYIVRVKNVTMNTNQARTYTVVQHFNDDQNRDKWFLASHDPNVPFQADPYSILWDQSFTVFGTNWLINNRDIDVKLTWTKNNLQVECLFSGAGMVTRFNMQQLKNINTSLNQTGNQQNYVSLLSNDAKNRKIWALFAESQEKAKLIAKK